MSIVKILKDGRVVNWKSGLICKDNEVRVFTSPGLRCEQVRKYYSVVRKMYPKISVDAIDAAFECYILGFIQAPEVLSFARRYDEVISEQSDGFNPPPLCFHELTGDLSC